MLPADFAYVRCGDLVCFGATIQQCSGPAVLEAPRPRQRRDKLRCSFSLTPHTLKQTIPSAAMIDWWRSWHGAPTDPKWLLIARNAHTTPLMVSAVAWALFDYASQHKDRGSVDGFDAETYAVWAGVELVEVEAVIAAMTAKRVIDGGRLRAWETRQPVREDDSRDRVRAHRARVTEQAAVDVTHGNADVTHGNASEKIREDKSREDIEVPTEPLAATPRKVGAASKPKVQPKPRKPNLLWDAVAELCGSPQTTNESKDFGETIKQLRAAEAEPSDVPGFGPWWRHEHPKATMTHRCLRDHWGRYLHNRDRPMDLAELKNPGVRAAMELVAEVDRDRRAGILRETGRTGFGAPSSAGHDGGITGGVQGVLPASSGTETW